MGQSDTRILVAESDPVLRMEIVDAFREADFDVLEACDGFGALDLLVKPDGVDLIVTSLGLSGADGLEVAERARTRGIPAPVVFVSGRSDLPQAKAHSPARSRRIAKPFNLVDLRAAVDDLLEVPTD